MKRTLEHLINKMCISFPLRPYSILVQPFSFAKRWPLLNFDVNFLIRFHQKVSLKWDVPVHLHKPQCCPVFATQPWQMIRYCLLVETLWTAFKVENKALFPCIERRMIWCDVWVLCQHTFHFWYLNVVDLSFWKWVICPWVMIKQAMRLIFLPLYCVLCVLREMYLDWGHIEHKQLRQKTSVPFKWLAVVDFHLLTYAMLCLFRLGQIQEQRKLLNGELSDLEKQQAEVVSTLQRSPHSGTHTVSTRSQLTLLDATASPRLSPLPQPTSLCTLD